MAARIYEEIEKKYKILYERYGGMMKLSDLTKELSANRRTALDWAREHSVGIRVGNQYRFETDQVASQIVRGRGML